MRNTRIRAALMAMAMMAASASAQAASIDLGARNFILGPVGVTASGAELFSQSDTDPDPLVQAPLFFSDPAALPRLDGFPGSSLSVALSSAGPNLLRLAPSGAGGPVAQFTITELGFTEAGPGDRIEFLLRRDPGTVALPGLGETAFATVVSFEFDFSAQAPLDFFAAQPDGSAFFSTITVAPLSQIPLPAGLVLMGTGLAALFGLGRRPG